MLTMTCDLDADDRRRAAEALTILRTARERGLLTAIDRATLIDMEDHAASLSDNEMLTAGGLASRYSLQMGGRGATGRDHHGEHPVVTECRRIGREILARRGAA